MQQAPAKSILCSRFLRRCFVRGTFAAMPVAGIDLGGTKLAAAVFTDGGEVLHRETVPLVGRQGAQVGALIADRLKYLGDRDW